MCISLLFKHKFNYNNLIMSVTSGLSWRPLFYLECYDQFIFKIIIRRIRCDVSSLQWALQVYNHPAKSTIYVLLWFCFIFILSVTWKWICDGFLLLVDTLYDKKGWLTLHKSVEPSTFYACPNTGLKFPPSSDDASFLCFVSGGDSR